MPDSESLSFNRLLRLRIGGNSKARTNQTSYVINKQEFERGELLAAKARWEEGFASMAAPFCMQA